MTVAPGRRAAASLGTHDHHRYQSWHPVVVMDSRRSRLRRAPRNDSYSITSATTFLPRNDAVDPIASTNGIDSAQIAASSA